MVGKSDEVWKSSSLAATYLEGVRAAIPLAQEQIDVMLRLIAACREPVQKFLDLGCGDGVLASAILRQYPNASGLLADFSAPMLDAGRKRFSEKNANVRFVNVDYGVAGWTKLVEDSGQFDAIVSGYSIHHQPNERKREIYQDIFGLLRPEGIFINIEHVASASPWCASLHDDLFIDYLQFMHPDQERAKLAATYYNRPDKAANILAPMELQCEWLREIGFVDVDCYLKVFELAVFGGRKPQPPVVS